MIGSVICDSVECVRLEGRKQQAKRHRHDSIGGIERYCFDLKHFIIVFGLLRNELCLLSSVECDNAFPDCINRSVLGFADAFFVKLRFVASLENRLNLNKL